MIFIDPGVHPALSCILPLLVLACAPFEEAPAPAALKPPPAAVANAIYGALGVRMCDLPMNPSAIMETLWRNGGG